MSLTIFSPDNLPSGPTGQKRKGSAAVSSDKRGVFTLTRGAADKVKLVSGDRIVVAQDPKNLQNIYLVKCQSAETGFELRSGRGKQKALLFFASAGLRKKIMAACYPALKEAELDKTFKLNVGASSDLDGKTCWGLLAMPIV